MRDEKTKTKTETRGDVFPYCTGNKHFDKLGEKTKNTRRHTEIENMKWG
jgi:hypothetical protein